LILASPAEPAETVQDVSMFSKPILACTAGSTFPEDLDGFYPAPLCGSAVDDPVAVHDCAKFSCAISPSGAYRA